MIKSTDFFFQIICKKTLEHHYKPPRALGNSISSIIYRLFCHSYPRDDSDSGMWWQILFCGHPGWGSASTFPHLRWRTLLLCISCSQGCKKKVEYVLLGRRRQSLGVGTFRIFCQIFQSAKQCMRPNSEEQLCGLAETSVAGVAQICTSQQTSELLLCTLKCFACSPSLQENNYGLTFSHSLNQTSFSTMESIPHWMHSCAETLSAQLQPKAKFSGWLYELLYKKGL